MRHPYPHGANRLGGRREQWRVGDSPDGISAFVARVLDQLSLSAWFPAAFLTSGVALLLEFRSNRSASISNAVADLAAHPVPALIMMVPLLVIATLVTQAFSFEAIRLLEGYWGWRWMSLVAKVLVWRHARRKKAIYESAKRESIKAFNKALMTAEHSWLGRLCALPGATARIWQLKMPCPLSSERKSRRSPSRRSSDSGGPVTRRNTLILPRRRSPPPMRPGQLRRRGKP